MSFDSPLPPYNASDPTATFLNASCLDLLMIEIVPMAYRIVHDITPDAPQPSSSLPSSAAQNTEIPAVAITGTSIGGTPGLKATGTGRIGEVGKSDLVGVKKRLDEEEEREAVFWRLEGLGYRVGQGLVERYVPLNCPLFITSSPTGKGRLPM